MSNYKASLIIFGTSFIISVISGKVLLMFAVIIVFFLVLGACSFRIQSNFYLHSINKVNTDKKNIILSFDDGPSPNTTPLVLDVLKEYKCQAIFFCIGNKIKGNESILQRMAAEGHIIANHSFSHSPWFDFYSSMKVHDEIKKTNEEIYRATSFRSKLFRPPYGVTNPMLANAIDRSGHSSVGWNKRSLDTVIKNKQKVVERILKNIQPGDIVLLHDSLSQCPDILKEFLQFLHKTDYKVERLDKIIEIECYEN
jgi:peptidoglycan/xylan/chitin deacetylase (PgdA/CDA1 family)